MAISYNNTNQFKGPIYVNGSIYYSKKAIIEAGEAQNNREISKKHDPINFPNSII